MASCCFVFRANIEHRTHTHRRVLMSRRHMLPSWKSDWRCHTSWKMRWCHLMIIHTSQEHGDLKFSELLLVRPQGCMGSVNIIHLGKLPPQILSVSDGRAEMGHSCTNSSTQLRQISLHSPSRFCNCGGAQRTRDVLENIADTLNTLNEAQL